MNARGGLLPLPFLLFLGVAIGIAAATAGQVELRLSPRPPLFTASFSAFFGFVLLVLLPVSVYFYVFHGDWFLLYVVDTGQVPSAVALVGFALQAAISALGFVLGAVLVRAQHTMAAYIAIAVSILLAVAVVPLAAERLRLVGTFAQYHGAFGLLDFAETPLARGAMAMGAFVVGGAGFLLSRLGRAHK